MIHIQLDDDGAEYELREFHSPVGITHVIDPAECVWTDDVNWAEVAPPWGVTLASGKPRKTAESLPVV